MQEKPGDYIVEYYKSEGANACWHVDGELQHHKIKIMYCIGVFLVMKIVPNK